MYPFHEEVQKYFPTFDYKKCVGDRNVICRMDSGANNKVGHQQRAFSCWWALKTCGPMDLGLDIGSPRGLSPYCIHVDRFGSGAPHPFYGGEYRSDVVWDAADVSKVFPAETFPFVGSNHSLEHMNVRGDAAVVDVLSGWLRVLREGGILAMIVPDNAWFDVMASDKNHYHAWSHQDFQPRVLTPLLSRGGVELVEYDTLDNHYSFDCVLRKS